MLLRSAIVFLLLIAFVLPASAKADRPPEPPGASVEIGAVAPDFTLKTLDGETVSLSQFRGKVVFLNFWASWCPPCRAEMPSMERLYEVFAEKGFVMLAVNTEQDPRAVRSFLDKYPHAFPVLLDPEGKAQSLYQVFRFPETFLIGKDGKILERYLGARDWSAVEFLKLLDSLLKG